ncbi:ATP-binding protein [Nonomuraea sp. CA-143628]|uniref:ATP-binding protein n=1 Tax=Nonomuraea sp. CA-143628 TaxID=3239997 RepID=UPI003D8BEFB3
MAGTLHFRLRVAHIYQRRFDSISLAQALSSSHWYLITRRPGVKLIPGSFRYEDEILTADFVTRDTVTGVKNILTLGSDTRHLGELTDFHIYEEGSYFSFRTERMVVHGDSWALASLLAQARGDISHHEILYAGQAYGINNSRNSYERTLTHKKLQRIYEDHIDSGYEIFVAPLVCDKSTMISDDHIDDAEPGPDLTRYLEDFVATDGKVLKSSVDLIEHSIISHFTPYYNEKLVEWRASRPTDAMRKMREAGFRLIHIHLSGWHGLARFFSPSATTPFRSHLISHDLPPIEIAAPDVLRGISAQKLSDWRFGSFMLREGQELLADLAENSGATMTIFGEAAPSVRKPPGISITLSAPPTDTDAPSRISLTSEIYEARERERRASEAPQHPGIPTYDPATGAVKIGEYVDGKPSYMQLHDPETGSLHSILIIGDPGMGKSTGLRSLAMEAYGSDVFDVILVDPLDRNGLAHLSELMYKDLRAATNLSESVGVLEVALKLIRERKEKEPYGVPTRDNRGLFIAIDDADNLFLDERGALLIELILSAGGDLGIGLIVAVSNISDFEPNGALMRALMKCKQRVAYMPNGYYVMSDLMARFGSHRPYTWDGDSVSFILRRDSASISIGIIAAIFDPELDPPSVQSLCADELIPSDFQVEGWSKVESMDYWRIMDLNMTDWRLSKHEDAWILSHGISTISSTALKTSADALAWADGVFKFRFEGDLTPWQVGPTVDGVVTLYADTVGEVIAKHQSLESAYRLFMERY